jgi:type II secretory pathway component PulJ
MKKTQKGFAHLSLLLLLVLVAVVAYAGYKVVNDHQKSTSDNQTSTALTQGTGTINSRADLDKALNTLNGQNVEGDLNPGSLDSDISSLL